MWISRDHRDEALKDLDQIYSVLCAEDMDGSFRANYILKQLDKLRWILDKNFRKKAIKEARRQKRHEHRQSRVRNQD